MDACVQRFWENYGERRVIWAVRSLLEVVASNFQGDGGGRLKAWDTQNDRQEHETYKNVIFSVASKLFSKGKMAP